MEIVLLIEGASACSQCQRRPIPIIRHTETSRDVSDCATISDVGGRGATAGEAVDEEILSASVNRSVLINPLK